MNFSPTEVGIYKRKQENTHSSDQEKKKKERKKHALDQENDQEKKKVFRSRVILLFVDSTN